MEVQTPTRPVLVALLVSSLFVGISWAALIPMWHTPDEQAHFAQAQDIAAIGHRPNPGHSTSADIVRSEELLGTLREKGNNQFTYHPEYRIPYSKTTEGIFEEEISNFPIPMRTEFVTNEATGYPPLYYWLIGGVNRLFWEQDLITRVFLSRVVTVFLSTAGIFVVFLLSREVLHSSLLSLISAALVSFHPMWRFVGSGVTSDALMNIWSPLVLWFGLRFFKKPSNPSILVFFFSLILGLLIKPQAVLLFLWAVPMVLWVLLKKKNAVIPVVRWFLWLLIGLGIFLIAVAVAKQIIPRIVAPYTKLFWVTNAVGIPDIKMVLSPHPSISEYVRQTGSELYRQTLPWYFGVYRWLSLTLPLWVYRGIKLVILVSLVGWIIGIFRRSISFVVRRSSLVVFMISSVTYALGLLTWNFFFWKSQGFPFGIQGRYFFPNLPEHMIFILIGILLIVPESLRRLSGFLTFTLMLFFHWYSLWFVSASYYDTSSLSTFFIQASQYKPWFFKMPYLPVWLFAGVVSSVVFIALLGYHILNRSSEKV